MPIAVSVWGSSRPVPKRRVEHLALGVGQLGDRAVHDALTLVLVGDFLGSLLLGGQQIAQRRVAIFTDLLVEADERVALVAHFFDLLQLETGLLRQLLIGGLAPEAHRELALHTADLARALRHVHGQADRAAAVLEAALDRLADPQGGVGGEAKALAPVELLARADQAKHALLHEVRQRQALVLVAPRVGGHQAQVRVDHQFLGVQVALLDALRQFDLLRRSEQRVAPRVRQQLIDGLRDEALRRGQRQRRRGRTLGGRLGARLRVGLVGDDRQDGIAHQLRGLQRRILSGVYSLDRVQGR